MKEIGLNQALVFTLVFFILVIVFSLKFFGASDIPELVEKDGYCKLSHGEDWNYIEDEFHCYNLFLKEKEYFTEEQFRQTCPKNTFISNKFHSDCFHNGDPRS